MAQETKLEYNWINERLKIRRLSDVHKLEPAQIAKRMNYPAGSKGVSQVNAQLTELALIEEYLERYLKGARTNYKTVDDKEQMFHELQKRLPTKKGAYNELAKAIAFPLVRGSKVIQDRGYEY